MVSNLSNTSHPSDLDNLIFLPSSSAIPEERSWLKAEIKTIGAKKILAMVRMASKQASFSYSPYSKYKVGACLLAQSGRMYLGNNAERATYSETDHAEEAAVTQAVVAGEAKTSGRKFIKAIAVSHKMANSPCGRCRQILVEHCDNCVVINCNLNGEIKSITSLKILLPDPFTPSDLGF